MLLQPFLCYNLSLAESIFSSTETVKSPPMLLLKMVDFIMAPFSRGAMVRLPLIDTDPNRGPTFGALPVWVFQNPEGTRIKSIHAPSLTYNEIFRWNTTYRYYHYPTSKSELDVRVSYAQRTNRDFMLDYKGPIASTELDIHARFHYDRDGSKRFFGFGPHSEETQESNYTLDSFTYLVDFGFPVIPDTAWKIRLGHQLTASKISNGPVTALSDIGTMFPEFITSKRQKTVLYRLGFGYDTRDHKTTTKQGMFWDTYAEAARRPLGSDTNFHRYGTDFRWFIPQNHFWTAALRFQFQHALGGEIPFYLQSSLGGKYTFRGYGEGRFIDRGMMVAGLEERCKIWEYPIAGVMAEASLDPFYQAGLVYPTALKMQMKYIRQVIGIALRMIARPQVVGSLDFGIGDEGLSIFMDINYSY
ncbi:MAG: BamA/TamA family outer membrane protein [Elusimicrobia bacterium]|nr:BamA/TamA family outer membrane protein [Elusimicrobiota bacterium]